MIFPFLIVRKVFSYIDNSLELVIILWFLSLSLSTGFDWTRVDCTKDNMNTAVPTVKNIVIYV